METLSYSSGSKDLYTVLQKNPFFTARSNFNVCKIIQCGEFVSPLAVCRYG